MTSSLFFRAEECLDENHPFILSLASYSETQSKQIYVISKALGSDNTYNYNNAVVLLVPKYKICIINLDSTCEDQFEVFCDDFIDDLGYLSDKFEYKKFIGRPREWKDKLIVQRDISNINSGSIEEFLQQISIDDKQDERKTDFLISLLIGSINDISHIGAETPETLLDKVKRKIILFDGDQSRFIYEKVNKKRVTIQGLAGTGKTELLLHKLRELYVNNKDNKIVFTCFNKILAQSMKTRIPDFFNFMKVEEQIKWEKRLWVIYSWGSGSSPNSGLYSYICSHYNIPFIAYSPNNQFDKVCQAAINELNSREEIKPCFDYILIDESQDFPKSFFDLCELVTQNTVYIAGDIFQDIYDRTIEQSVQSDYLLNKCYRTDPKTLMFAHAVGMGLYEKPVLRWLEDNEWAACGYNVIRDQSNNSISLSRSPLRRFEDLETASVSSIQLIESEPNEFLDNILAAVDQIKEENPTVSPGDIAVVFLESVKSNYNLADLLEVQIVKKYKWPVIKGYETKDKRNDSVFISNRNNIKGLEFPFVICVARGSIMDDIYMRNTIYMMLTRSFLTSFFVVNNMNQDFIATYKAAINDIVDDGIMQLREPSPKEKEAQNRKVRIATQKKRKSLIELIDEVLGKYPEIDPSRIRSLRETLPKLILDEYDVYTEDEIKARTDMILSVILTDSLSGKKA